MKAHPVSRMVNSSRFEDPRCIEPLMDQLQIWPTG
jgi:hypothetical protein